MRIRPPRARLPRRLRLRAAATVLAVAKALRRLADHVAGEPPPAPRPPHLADAPEHWLRMVAEHAPALLRPEGTAVDTAPELAPLPIAQERGGPQGALAPPPRPVAATTPTEAAPGTGRGDQPAAETWDLTRLEPVPGRRPASTQPSSELAAPGTRRRPHPSAPEAAAAPARPTRRRAALPRVRPPEPAPAETAPPGPAPDRAPSHPAVRPHAPTFERREAEAWHAVDRGRRVAQRPALTRVVPTPYPELPRDRTGAHPSGPADAVAAPPAPAPLRPQASTAPLPTAGPRWSRPEAPTSYWPDLPAAAPAGSARVHRRLDEWRTDLVRIQEVG